MKDRIRVFRGVALAFMVLFAVSAQAAGPDVEKLLASMRTAYQHVKSVTFTTESHFPQETYTCKFSFVNPNKIRAAVTAVNNPALKIPVIRMTDGVSIYAKAGMSNSYRRSTFRVLDYERGLPVNLESLCFFDWDQQLSTARGKNMEHSTFIIEKNQPWEGKNWLVLQETATNPGVVCRYYIDPKTFLIWRTSVKPTTKSTQVATDQWITHMDLSAKLSDSMFKPSEIRV